MRWPRTVVRPLTQTPSSRQRASRFREAQCAYSLELHAQRRYTKEERVGEGTYAVVYRGCDNETGQRVALKKIKMTQHGAGLDISAIRELKYLKELHHPNIAKVRARRA